AGSYATNNDAHTHEISGLRQVGGEEAHNHATFSETFSRADSDGGSVGNVTSGGDTHNHDVNGTSGSTSHSHSITGTSGVMGSGAAHENRPPFLALNFIIKI
ncbi:MAG: hypothetical protein R3330_04225, partial [Saprospiraceae bacterium]|nr:hypothetical protein [Saprospiraceae bacterium]